MRFPFSRERSYLVGELRTFEAELRVARQADPELSRSIRGHKLPWAKLWTEEMLPLWLYAGHSSLPDDDEFRMMIEGHPVDAEIRSRSVGVLSFQITTAYPEWDEPGQDARSGGYVRHLERFGSNQGVPIFGGGRISKAANGRVTSQPRARSPEISRLAWQAGLAKAIAAKVTKSVTYAGKVDVLLVYANRLRFETIDDRTEDIVLLAMQTALHDMQSLPFRKLIVLDQDSMSYVEFPQ